MSQRMTALCAQMDRLVHLCEKLQECLHVERGCLIAFNVEELLKSNSIKEASMMSFANEKARLMQILQELFSVNKLAELPGVLAEGSEEAKLWDASYDRWLIAWEKTDALTRANRRFLDASQKTLGRIHDNLLELFGQKPTYNQSGSQVKRNRSGAVVEAKY